MRLKYLYRSVLPIIICLLFLINISSCYDSRNMSEISKPRDNTEASAGVSKSTQSSINTVSVTDPYPNLSGFENEYTQAYIDENKNNVYKLQQNKEVTFITVQDVHIDSIDSKRYDQLRDIVIITEQLHIDYVAVLGDLTSSLYDHDTSIAMLKKVKEILDQCHCSVYYTRGDHEYNATNENWGTNKNDYRCTLCR